MPEPIRRMLAYEDDQQSRRFIGEEEIAALPGPLVILGDPGLGKTVLTEGLGGQQDMTYCPAGTFVRASDPRVLAEAGDRIVIDGLDEIASARPGAGVDAVLSQLSAMGNPPFILSCREADWRGAADRGQIRQDYRAEPVLLHLQPFDLDDARAFLSNEFPGSDPAFVLNHLLSRGLDGLYKNPLTLRLLGEVAYDDGPLPDSRAELLERACRVMLNEENRLHQEAEHAQARPDELLLAAGAICAVQLLCDSLGVFTGPSARTPEGWVHIGEVRALPFANAARDALRTRLFQAVAEGRFTHIHRVVAEYLGAAWLARCVGERCSERGLFSLFRPGDGVPTSLRGLHAWIGHFNGALASSCIAADPYGVLRYGDVEMIGMAQARVLLSALQELSEIDPYFASEDWGRHRAPGLMRSELSDDIHAIVTAPDRNLHLSMLLLNAMVGTDLARELTPVLDSIMFDPNYVFEERWCAAEALRASDSIEDPEAAIHRLLELGDARSARLACEFLTTIEASAVSSETAVATVLAHLRITEVDNDSDDGSVVTEIRDGLFCDLEPGELAELLDRLSSRAGPLVGDAGRPARSAIADLIRRLTVRVLEAGFAVAPGRLWAWVCWVDGHDGYDQGASTRLAELLAEDRPLRSGFLEHVLLTPCGENTWMAAHGMFDLGLLLSFADEDVIALLRAARARAGAGPIEGDTWRGLLQLGRTRDGICEVVREAAREAASGDPALLEVLDELSDPVPAEWEAAQARREALAEEERREVIRLHREAASGRMDAIDSGDFRALAGPAEAYLGRWPRVLDGSLSPESRLNELLGEALSERVRAGFIAVLHRDDLPSAAAIAQVHARRRGNHVELPMICGISELLRQGRSLDGVDRATLAATYMAWWRTPECGSEGQIDIGSALEEALFTDDRYVEAHFRTSIEPELAAGVDHVVELYRLTHEPRLAHIAGPLAVDWLRIYPGLPSPVETELVSCAVGSAADELAQRLDIAGRIEDARDEDAMRLWLSASFLVEYQLRGDALRAAAADEPVLVWYIRDRLGDQYQEDFSRLSVAQLLFVVETFAPHWPLVARPRRAVRGYGHGWDASEFIERTILSLAARTCSEATEALQYLVDGPAMSYVEAARHALALQRKARRDAEYAAPTIGELQRLMEDGLPDSVDGMRACLLDRLDWIQERMQASDTDPWEVYWREDGRPKGETFCRNRLVDQLRDLVPLGIQIEPEAQMPGVRRADFTFGHDNIRLPIEIKGQWHRDVWDAASEQLDAYYAREWRAKGRGLYLVLWFGRVRRKQLKRHPERLVRPETPDELRQMLVDRIPKARRVQLDVFVLDLTPPPAE